MKKEQLFRIIRILFFLGFLIAGIVMITEEFSMEDPGLIVWTASLLTGIVGLFFEIYKKREE